MLKKKGVILITTLMFVTMIVMFSIIVAQQGRDTLLSGAGYTESEQAYMAALSGIEYAKAQLSLTSGWGKLHNGQPDAIDTASCNYFNEGENITFKDGGLIAYLNEDKTQSFSISFSPSPENDASDTALMKGRMCKYMSYNNLDSDLTIYGADSKAAPANRLEGSVEISSRYKGAPVLRRDVPGNTFYIVSKGVSGKHVKYVEAMLVRDSYSGNTDGASMISGNTVIKSSKSRSDNEAILNIKHIDKKSKAKIVSAGKIQLLYSGGEEVDSSTFNKAIVSETGVAVSAQDLSGADKNSLKDSVVSYEKIENPDETRAKFSSEFELLSDFSDVTKEYRAIGNNVLAHGTYFSCDDEWKFIDKAPHALSDGSVGFTDEEMKTAKTILLSGDSMPDGGDIADYRQLGDAISINNRTVSVNGKVSSDSSLSGSSSPGLTFAIIDKKESGDSFIYSISDSDSVDFQIGYDGAVVSDGDLNIKGELIGNGKVFANNRLFFNGSSSLETAPNSGVVAWAGDSVTIDPAKNVSDYSYEKIGEQIGIKLSDDDGNDSEKEYEGDGIQPNFFDRNFFGWKLSRFSFDGKEYGYCDDVDLNSKLSLGFEIDSRYYNDNSIISYVKPDGSGLGGIDSSKIVLSKDEISKYDDKTNIYVMEQNGNLKLYLGDNKYRLIGKANSTNLSYSYKDYVDDLCDKEQNIKVNCWPAWNNLNAGSFTLKGKLKVVVNANGECQFKIVDSNDESYDSVQSYLNSEYAKSNLIIDEYKWHGFRIKKVKTTSYEYNNGKFYEYTSAKPKKPENRKEHSKKHKELNEKVKAKITNIHDNIYIKGSLFSNNGGITINTDGAGFFQVGAIMTNNGGNLFIDGTSIVNMIYDPDYVPELHLAGIHTASKFTAVFDY